ncbi:MAG: methyltransferase domain-containing protein [Candidatus Pacearchaeota archaeon]
MVKDSSNYSSNYSTNRQTLHHRINKGFFNVNKKNGRWSFSTYPESLRDNTNLNNEFDNILRTLVINVTDRCNLDCLYCSRQSFRKEPKEMDPHLLEKILKKASDYAEKNRIRLIIQFHGGEPLLNFNKIIKAVDKLSKDQQKYLMLRIQTNATLLNSYILNECKKRKIEIGISLDGRKEENDLVRIDREGKGSFKKIIKNLKLLKKYQKNIRCLTVITNANIKKLDQILKFFSSIGITEVNFLPLNVEPKTKTIKKELIPELQTMIKYGKKLFDTWVTLLKNEKTKINIPLFQTFIWNLLSSNSKEIKKFRINCGAGINSIFINADGTAWACGPFCTTNKLKLGDLNYHSFFDIQKHKNYKTFKKRITQNIKKCKNCAFQYICKGGCPVNSFRKKWNLFEADNLCEFWKEIIKHILSKIYKNQQIIKLIPESNILKLDSASEAITFYKMLGIKNFLSLTNKKRDKAMMKYILSYITKKDKILDLCCGYGRITIPLAKKGYKVEGIDICPFLIKFAREVAKKKKLRIKFRIGDMRKLPYKDYSFDKIICLWSSFNHLLTEEDQIIALKEIYRCLKKNGKFIMDLPNGESKWAKENIKKYGRIVPDVIKGVKLFNYIHDKKTLNYLAEKLQFKNYVIKFANIGGKKRIVFILTKS